MDWTLAIERNGKALRRILAMLVAMAGGVVAPMDADPAGQGVAVEHRPATPARRVPLVTAVPGELDECLPVAGPEPAVHLALDRDEAELPEPVLLELEIRRTTPGWERLPGGLTFDRCDERRRSSTDARTATAGAAAPAGRRPRSG